MFLLSSSSRRHPSSGPVEDGINRVRAVITHEMCGTHTCYTLTVIGIKPEVRLAPSTPPGETSALWSKRTSEQLDCRLPSRQAARGSPGGCTLQDLLMSLRLSLREGYLIRYSSWCTSTKCQGTSHQTPDSLLMIF